MILDITGSLVGDLKSSKLGEDVLQRFAANVGLNMNKFKNMLANQR
jgi:hypothetical protein